MTVLRVLAFRKKLNRTVIERSVKVDISMGRTIAKLPFLSNPMHKLRPNTGVAFKVYQSQVRKLGKTWNYQVYFWNDSFNITDPKWKVIKTLIYGVKSSGNQAECGLKKTAKLMETGHERASEVIHKDIYVDDYISGDDDFEKVRVVTDDLKVVHNRGGFILKGIIESWSPPPPPRIICLRMGSQFRRLVV